MRSWLRLAVFSSVLLALTGGALALGASPPALSSGRAASNSEAHGQAKAAPVPSPQGCTGLEQATAKQLVEAAWTAIDKGKQARALACADAAVALAPRGVSALSVRAGALAALDRIADARAAYARALAVDPNDPETLLGAAELYVRRTGDPREILETGLAHALRGVRFVSRHKDRELFGRLELVAGMAENDLGRSHLALPHLEHAVAALPDDADAIYEEGIALYELCRFDGARLAFERTLTLAKDDPWALYQLGLVAERKGEARQAASFFERARTKDPKDFLPDLEVSAARFRAEVERALSRLPASERRALRNVPVEVRDLPDESDLLAVRPPLSPSILGLFRGPSENELCTPADGQPCRSIVIYRKNLLRFAKDPRELERQVQITLLHELGHLHGLDDEQLRARGLE